MTKGIVQKLGSLKDRDTDRQIDNIMLFFKDFPFLGMLADDPTTTGWDDEDVSWWVNTNNASAVVIKFWDGSAVKTVTSS